jgi:predicted DNA-binding transcriptional regulator AlpA
MDENWVRGRERDPLSEMQHGHNRLLRLPEVEALTGLSRGSIDRREAEGAFPRSVRIGSLRRWNMAEVNRWIEAGCPSKWADNKKDNE